MNAHEMQWVCKLLAKIAKGIKTVARKVGKWSWIAANPMPSWESVQRAPLWIDEE